MPINFIDVIEFLLNGDLTYLHTIIIILGTKTTLQQYTFSKTKKKPKKTYQKNIHTPNTTHTIKLII